MNIIGYITILVTCLIIWVLYIKARQEELYINTKNGKKYRGVGIVKMKDLKSNAWVDAILYIDLKNGQYYVLDKKEFMEICIILKDWKKDGRKIRKDKKRN